MRFAAFGQPLCFLNAILQDRVRRFARFARGLLIEWLVVAPNRRRSVESLMYVVILLLLNNAECFDAYLPSKDPIAKLSDGAYS